MGSREILNTQPNTAGGLEKLRDLLARDRSLDALADQLWLSVYASDLDGQGPKGKGAVKQEKDGTKEEKQAEPSDVDVPPLSIQVSTLLERLQTAALSGDLLVLADKPGSPKQPKGDEKVGDDKPGADGKPDRPVKLAGEDLKRVHYLQDTLRSLSTVYLDFHGQDPEKIAKEIKDFQERLKKERAEGVFGPATQEAYKKYVSWLQKAVPETIREMDSLGRAIPPGSPLTLPRDRFDRAISPQFYKALAAEGKLALDLELEPGKLPTDAQLNKLDNTYQWLGNCNQSVAEARAAQKDRWLDRLISEQGLPESWRLQPGDDPRSWRASAEEMVDLAVRTRNYVEAMQSLYKAARRDDFPLVLPPGTSLVLEKEDGKLQTVTDQDIANPSVRHALKNAKIREVRLDLPTDLRQDNPRNELKIQRLREWLTTHGDKIDQAVGELVQLQKNPDAVIMYGDQEVRNGKALLNSNNEFVRLVSGKYVAKAGESVHDTNLLGYDFEVEKLTDGPLAGRYKISQTIQAEHAPWYAYQNIRKFVDEVGKPMQVDEKLEPEQAAARYKITAAQLAEMIDKKQLHTTTDESGKKLVICPKILDGDDFAPVRNGAKIEIVKAKNLQSFRNTQKGWYVGEKALAITMDAAMLVSGTIEVGAAVKGARLAAVGSEAALKLTGTQAARELAKGAVRIGVAGAGVLNNAGARDTDWGTAANTARGIYFLGDIGLGLASSGWNAFRAGKAAEAMSGAEKVQAVIHGRKAVEGVEALKGIPWVKHAHTGTQWAFKASELGFAPVIIKDLKHQLDEIRALGKREADKDAVIQIGDGRGMQLAKPEAFNPADANALAGARAVLDGYAETLCCGRSKETEEEVRQIFQNAKRLLAPDVNEDDRSKYREQLLAKITFTPEQIRDLELAHPNARTKGAKEFHLSAAQLHDLNDPEKRKNLPKPVRDLAEKIAAQKNSDIEAAAKIALLYLARDKDGKIAREVATTKITVPEHKRTIITSAGRGGQKKEEVTVPEHAVTQSITVADVVRDLKRDLESPNLGNRGIATGELLTRVGAITHQQYGGILQDVLSNPQSSKDDKMRALQDARGPRMAAIIDGVRHQESQADNDRTALGKRRELGKHHGLSCEDLMKTLDKTASNDKDPDVRAMAAATLYGLREKDAERRAQLLSGFNTLYEQAKGKPGEFAKAVQELLKKEMKTDIPEGEPALQDRVRESRLHAALALGAITDKNSPVQKEITEAIARSFSPTNAVLAAKTIDALIPERLQQLQKDPPALANQLRLAALGHIKTPDSRQDERDIVTLLERMEPLLEDGDPEIRRQLVGKLHDQLRDSELNTQYVRHYPALRAAAIDTLVKEPFLTQNSLDVIRAHVSAQPSIKLGKQEIQCNEPAAQVRLAAARALEKLKDPHLRQVMNEIIDKETDAAVAAQLRDVRFTQQRIEPSSREYKELYERTRVELAQFGDKYPYLKDFDDKAQCEWLDEKFPLLNRDTYRDKARSAIDNANGWWFRRTSLEATINYEEWKAANELHKERLDQWKELAKLAAQGGEDGNKAKLLLHHIVTHNGGPLGSTHGLEAGAIRGFYNENHYHSFYECDWQSMAARELSDLAKENPEGRDIVAYCIRRGLTKNEQLRGSISFRLLDGWNALGTKDKNGFAISREELAQVTAEALETEIGRQKANQTDYYQDELLTQLKNHGHRMVFPVVEAIKDGSQFKHIREKSNQMLSDMRDSVEMMWDNTNKDTQATAQQRADRLRKALEDKHNAETTVQEIFNAYKGFKITDRSDLGLSQLHLAMNESNERVRLAAAKVLMESQLPPDHPAKAKAAQTLSELIVTGSAPAYRKEAYKMLNKVNLDQPLLIGAPNGRLIRFEKDEGGQVKATEYTKGKVSGYIYPGGGTFRFTTNKNGEMTEHWENGSHWIRKEQDGKVLDEWFTPVTRETWKGTYLMLPNNEYQFTSKKTGETWLRKADGSWVKRPVKPEER